MIEKVTLDTNLLHEYWKHRDKASVVAELLARARRGSVHLAVTARVHEDIPRRPLSDRLNELPMLKIEEAGSIVRVGLGVIGRDMIASDAFRDYWPTACRLAEERVNKAPDWRDWDYLHAHYLLQRDVFLTWDKGILCLSGELKQRFGVVVLAPEQYISEAGMVKSEAGPPAVISEPDPGPVEDSNGAP
jgi:hypothetical protein